MFDDILDEYKKNLAKLEDREQLRTELLSQKILYCESLRPMMFKLLEELAKTLSAVCGSNITVEHFPYGEKPTTYRLVHEDSFDSELYQLKLSALYFIFFKVYFPLPEKGEENYDFSQYGKTMIVYLGWLNGKPNPSLWTSIHKWYLPKRGQDITKEEVGIHFKAAFREYLSLRVK